MKNKVCKYIILLVTLLFLANPLFGFGQWISPVSPVILGAGVDIAENNIILDITLLQVRIHTDIGLGFGVDLFRSNYIANNNYFSTINPQLYWHITTWFPFIPTLFAIFAPTFGFSDYLIFTGIRFAHYAHSHGFYLEGGYKYVSEKNTGGFYISLKFDVIGIVGVP